MSRFRILRRCMLFRLKSWRQVLCMIPSPIQSPKENKLKLWPKYMYYNVHCTNVRMYISDFFTKFILDVSNYSELCLAVPCRRMEITVPVHHCTSRCHQRGTHRGFLSVVVSPAGRSEILKSSIPEDSNPALLFWRHSDWPLHAARAIPIVCFNRNITQPLSRGS